jgi:predicted phage tail protein
MTNFADTFADQTVSYELDEDSWSTFLLDGTAGQALEVTVEAPNGMYKLDSKGNYGSASVNVTLQYRLKGGAWSDWTTATISGSSSSAVRKTVRLDGLTAGQYEVRMKVASRSADKDSTTAMVRVYWTLATLIIYDDFCRPGKVLVGIKALATSQLSGSLSSVTWLQTRSKVQVYNPSTGAYEEKAATNPAWACYDLIHLGKQLMNVNTGEYEYCSFGAAKELFLYRRFQDWATVCENKELTVNILLDSAKNFCPYI